MKKFMFIVATIVVFLTLGTASISPNQDRFTASAAKNFIGTLFGNKEAEPVVKKDSSHHKLRADTPSFSYGEEARNFLPFYFR